MKNLHLNLEEFLALESSWEYLQNTDLPIFVFGMGDGAMKILSRFERFKIPCAGFFASDEYVRGHSFQGHLVHKLSEIEEKVEDFIIVLAFAAGYEKLINKIIELDKNYKLVVPDVPVLGEILFTKEFLTENINDFNTVYNMLEDDLSRKVLTDTIKNKITGKIKYLLENFTNPQRDLTDLLKLNKNEDYLDLGGYNGDTVREFLELTESSYSSIKVVEPDKKNFKKLLKTTDLLENCEAFNCAIWEEDCTLKFSNLSSRQSTVSKNNFVKKDEIDMEARSVDSILKGEKATYIKYDVEGVEYEALLGSEKTLQNHTPKLKLALYHKSEDIIKLPLLLKKINPNYKFYLRQSPYIPAWELNLYAIDGLAK